MSNRVGYARVSTIGQTLDMQVQTLRSCGCNKIFKEKASGADSERSELKRLIRSISEGDTVIVTRIDRLARSTFDLFAIVRKITQKGAQFYSLAEPWADTATSTGRLMLAVLGGLADVERDLIDHRRVGRPPPACVRHQDAHADASGHLSRAVREERHCERRQGSLGEGCCRA